MRQHGTPGFKLANPVRDADLARECRDDVDALLKSDPALSGAQGKQLREELARAWAAAVPFMAG